jgi:lipoprotein-anchoring transpeptidase ErfK/SrfK
MGRVGRRGGRGVGIGVGGALALILLAGCSHAATAGMPSGPGHVDTTGPAKTTPAAPPARLQVRPANGATDISPNTPVIVTAGGGKLSAVTVRNAAGKVVKGAWSADRRRWSSAEPLGYSKTYSVTAAAANADGKQTTVATQFTTVTPATFTLPYLFPTPRMTVGVGQPITVRFDESIADKAAAERALKVTTSPAVAGAWHWFGDTVAHWRPKRYWQPGTKVTVAANVYGVNVGNNIYGQQDVATSFRIGASKIATINDNTHQMAVRFGGKVVRTIPVSMGRGGSVTVKGRTIYFTTQSGPHIVAEKYPIKTMSSESYGLPKTDPLGYEEKIPLAVRVTPDGEFVHAASWSVADQGIRNVSHGCINISPANAQWFYKNFSYGDIVDIRNTGAQMPFAPGYNEWGVPWSEWLAGSALQ